MCPRLQLSVRACVIISYVGLPHTWPCDKQDRPVLSLQAVLGTQKCAINICQLGCLILPLGSSQQLSSHPLLPLSSLPPQLEMIEDLLQRRKQIIRRLELCNTQISSGPRPISGLATQPKQHLFSHLLEKKKRKKGNREKVARDQRIK